MYIRDFALSFRGSIVIQILVEHLDVLRTNMHSNIQSVLNCLMLINLIKSFRYEKAAQDKEKLEDDLRRRPLPSDGPQLPSTVSVRERRMLGQS